MFPQRLLRNRISLGQEGDRTGDSTPLISAIA